MNNLTIIFLEHPEIDHKIFVLLLKNKKIHVVPNTPYAPTMTELLK
jgi:hypothetical protein